MYKYNWASKAATQQMTSELETELITPLVSSYVAEDMGRLVMWQRRRRCITPTITLITCTVQKQDVSYAKCFICIQIGNKGYLTSGVQILITGYMTRPVIHHVMIDETSWLNMIRLTEEHEELMGRIYVWYHFDRIWHKLRWKYFSF